jgi:hypothetical protein
MIIGMIKAHSIQRRMRLDRDGVRRAIPAA